MQAGIINPESMSSVESGAAYSSTVRGNHPAVYATAFTAIGTEVCESRLYFSDINEKQWNHQSNKSCWYF